MGKSSGYSGGTVSLNGQQKANSYKSGNTVYTNYNMSDQERQIYDYAQDSFAQNLPQMNVFSANTQQGFNDQIKAYTNQGMKIIDQTYTPLLDNLKTDIASRFGNFDNSSFLGQLNKIEEKRSDSINGLTQDIMAQRQNLVSNELAQRYEYMNFLNDIYNNINGTALGYINSASKNSSAGNTYNAQANRNNLSYASIFGSLGSAYAPTINKLATTAIGKIAENL